MQSKTPFNTSRPHIYLTAKLTGENSVFHTFRSILDTGAPYLEFSDRFLQTIGLLKAEQVNQVHISPAQQTQKYGQLVLPKIYCLGQTMEHVRVHISRFEESWGIDALIGLDFFRQFKVTVDYQKGMLLTERYSTL